jgi:hypothetical protein
MAKYRLEQIVVLMAVRLVQPGMLGDVLEGVQRLLPPSMSDGIDKDEIKAHLERLRELGLVSLYADRRYMLSTTGREYVAETGIKLKIDARRMFLLRETRQRKFKSRSDARDGSLKQ